MDAIIQGILQGLTEFLPISSSGHLELASRLFGFRGGIDFVAALHLGTFFAVFIFSFKKLIFALKRPRLILALFISTLPAFVVGVFLEDAIEKFFNYTILPYSFALTALFLLLGSASNGNKKMEDMNFVDALVIGLFQAAAVVPGLSRSGLTIASAMYLGYGMEDALYYSFLMSLPVTFGAGILKFQGAGNAALVGFFFSFIFGLLALFLLRTSVYKEKFHLFGYYLIFVSLVSYFAG